MTGDTFDDFEIFRRPAPPGHGEPLVTIQARGNLGLNAAAFETLGEPESVALLFSKARNAIGVKPVNPDAPEAYPVPRQGNANSWTVSGRAFMREYGIPIGKARKYRAELVDGILMVDLNQTPLPATSTRRSRKA